VSDERRRQPHDGHSGDDALDRLLAQARWDDPSPDAIHRLEQAWQATTPLPHKRPNLWSTAAAAALLLVALATSVMIIRKPSREPIAKAPTHVPTPPDREPVVTISSRAPTLWEQTMMLRGTSSPSASADRIQPAIDQAIAALTTSRAADLHTAAADLLQSGPRVATERHLLDDLARRSGAESLAAIRLLGVVGSDASVPTLLSAYADQDKRSAAAASIADLLSPAQLVTTITKEPDADRQRRLLGVLATHPAPGALSAYLALVANQSTSDTALAALDDLNHPPVDALFAHLDAPRLDRRLAAARALGRINGPAVSERLAVMVKRGVHRREALAALMSSGGPEASQFLSSFRQIPSLLSVIRSVERQLCNPF
jgi:hypothetical protein